ncbi:RYamide receptor-like [Thrips palmi]|uniref:RYamide receptor-like n=1 Tax=Thrips palmi TaxID=161013 RepID=A0A6P8ZLL8_THRPL|nr:RYamide receptor-like [Thrips palmi]
MAIPVVDDSGLAGHMDPGLFEAGNCTAWNFDAGTNSPYNCSFRNFTGAEEEELYDVPVGVIVLLSVFYGTISAVAVVGNSIVIWIVATSRSMQNVTNYYIANLALADIVIGLFAIPFQFQAALLQRWILPNFMCPFCPFVQVLTVTVSVFTLTAIAIDRHRAILNPLSARPSKLRAKISIAVIWLASAVLATPMAAALRVSEVSHVVDGRTVEKPFCSNQLMSKEAMMTYRSVLWVLQYFTPLCIITFVYARMALRLWGSRTPGTAHDTRDATIMRNKKKVIKMLVIVVALFALCWFPLQTYNILQDMFPRINSYKYINIIFFCCDWLAMSNSCYNPFIYGIYNEKFKREFQQRFPFRHRRRDTWGPHDSVDDKTLSAVGGTRSSVLRSTAYHHDWRRAYSSRTASSPRFYPPPPREYGVNGASETLYRPYAARLAEGQQRRLTASDLESASGSASTSTTELYVFPAARASSVAGHVVARKDSHSSEEGDMFPL